MYWYLIDKDNNKIDENNTDGFSIDKNNMKNFGIKFHDKHVYYDTYTGAFNLLKDKLSFSIKINDIEYDIDEYRGRYNDAICYKNFYSDINNGCADSSLRGYSFGYKTKITMDEYEFYFQPIIIMNLDDALKVEFKIVSNKDTDIQLLIKINNRCIDKIDASLCKNIKEIKTYNL